LLWGGMPPGHHAACRQQLARMRAATYLWIRLSFAHAAAQLRKQHGGSVPLQIRLRWSCSSLTPAQSVPPANRTTPPSHLGFSAGCAMAGFWWYELDRHE
jgi:hypothetical protein